MPKGHTTNRVQARVRRKFNRGIQRIFSKVFSNDIMYHAFVEGEIDPLYGEYESEPSYAPPVALTGNVNRTPNAGDTEPQEQRYDAIIRVTLHSCQDAGVPIEIRAEHKNIRKGLISYQGSIFEIITINPLTFLADMNMTYNLACRERKGMDYGKL